MQTVNPNNQQYASTAQSQQSLADVARVVTRHYGDEIWQAVKVAIAVITSLSFQNRDNCLVVVYEGASGKGKSITIRLVMPDRGSTEDYLIRVDDFTPAAFVSHAANKMAAQLKNIDLLPQVQDKVMLTKELAPLFRDDEKQLRQSFARLTSVLDGNGYTTASGTHGKRGYVGKYLFNWLGATTPIPDRTFKIMAQLGNRILFYEIASDEWSEDRLMDFAENYRTDDAVEESQKTVNDYLDEHFGNHSVNSVDPDSISIPQDLRLQIVRYAKLIASGRVEVEVELAQGFNAMAEYKAGVPEGPQRVILLLQTLARSLALADGRDVVTTDDLEPLWHIAFSSIPPKRRELLRALVKAGGTLDSTRVETTLGVSKPTALHRMKELSATKMVDFKAGNPAGSMPAEITLAQEWVWLLNSTPIKQSPSVSGSAPSAATPP